MLTVACVLSGGQYNQSHVSRLKQMLLGRISKEYRFVCVDDSPYPGWWAKTSLFEPGRFEGRVFYLDLDVTVVGNLDEVIDYPVPFAAIKDYLSSGINSSVMVWDAGTLDHVYTKFNPTVMERLHGDQDYLDTVTMASRFPKKWFPSYKYHCQSGVPAEAKVVIYHGKPKPWDM